MLKIFKKMLNPNVFLLEEKIENLGKIKKSVEIMNSHYFFPYLKRIASVIRASEEIYAIKMAKKTICYINLFSLSRKTVISRDIEMCSSFEDYVIEIFAHKGWLK